MCINKAKATKNKSKGLIPSVKVQKNIKSRLPIPQDEINSLKERRKEKLLFSFKFLDKLHKAFNLGNINTEWYITLLDNLKEVSNLTRNELVVNQRQHYHAHDHKWEELDYCYDFDEDFLLQVECLQFRLSSSDGRVHGFIVGNRFYIVWLDAHHNLYPDERFGGRKFYQKPLNCYEQKLIEVEQLKEEIKQKEKQIEEFEEILNELTLPDNIQD